MDFACNDQLHLCLLIRSAMFVLIINNSNNLFSGEDANNARLSLVSLIYRKLSRNHAHLHSLDFPDQHRPTVSMGVQYTFESHNMFPLASCPVEPLASCRSQSVTILEAITTSISSSASSRSVLKKISQLKTSKCKGSSQTSSTPIGTSVYPRT